jgi:AraC-like DNA-binding protein
VEHQPECAYSLVLLGSQDFDPHIRYFLNVYPERQIIVISKDVSERTHALVHERANLVCFYGQLDYNYIGGWLTDGKLVISLSDCRGAGSGTVSDKLIKSLVRHERAYEIAHHATTLNDFKAWAGESRALFEGDSVDARTFAMMMGKLHLTYDLNELLPHEFLKKKLIYLPVGEDKKAVPLIYDSAKRVRYIFPDQIEALAKYYAKATDSEVSHEKLKVIADALRPDASGKRHVSFLISHSLDSHQGSDANLEATLIKIAHDAEEKAHKDTLATELTTLAKQLRKFSDPKLIKIDLSDDRFVEAMYEVLQGSADHAGLGADFSTALKALPTGRSAYNQDGTLEFQVDPEATKETIAFVDWILKNFKAIGLDNSPDYICVLEPQVPLTHDRDTSNAIIDLGRIEPRAWVVVCGTLGSQQIRLVVRDNMYSPATWDKRDTKIVSDMIQRLGGEASGKLKLSQIAGRFRHHQYELLRLFARELGDNPNLVSFAEPYRQISLNVGGSDDQLNFEWRPFINGVRMDKEDLSKWSLNSFKSMLEIDGRVMVLAYLGQFAQLNLSDYVVASRSEDKVTPLAVTHLSASGSFCDSLGCKDLKGYIGLSSRVLANHIASWVQDCMHRPQIQSDLAGTDRKETMLKLINTAIDSFERALGAIIDQEQTEINQYMAQIRSEFEQLKDLPDPVNLPKFLDLTQSLLEMTVPERRLFANQVRTETVQICEILDGLVSSAEGEYPQQLDPELLESSRSCIEAGANLLCGHVSDERRYGLILNYLKAAPERFNKLSIKEREWCTTAQDLFLRCAELSFTQVECVAIIKLCRLSNGDSELYHKLTITYPKLNLSLHSVAMLREAIAGIEQAKQDSDKEKREVLDAAFLPIEPSLLYN